jgi:hypothetical protein
LINARECTVLKVLKYIGIALVSLVVLAVITLMVLASPPGERWLKSWLERRMTADLDLPVSIADNVNPYYALSLIRLSSPCMGAATGPG